MNHKFSFQKAWTDLTLNKKYFLELLTLMILMTVLMLVAKFTSLKLLPILGYTIWLGYLILLSNNIINSKEPVLEDIFHNKKGRNIFIIALKFIGLSIIYGITLGFFWSITSFFFNKILAFSQNKAFVIAIVISIPLLLFISIFGVLLFSEKLRFRDGFNVKKALISFKYAWVDYLVAISFAILGYILLIAAMIPFVMLFSFILAFIVKTVHIYSQNLISICSNIIGMILGNFIAFILGYFYYNIVAQIYKSSQQK